MLALLFALFFHLSTPTGTQPGCHVAVCHPPVVTQYAPCQGASHQAGCYLPRFHRR